MEFAIDVVKRDQYGKNASRRIRRDGKIPAILYGAGTDAVALTLEKADIVRILKSDSGENTLFTVNVGDENMTAMIRDLQMDPVKDEILHVDLIHIAMDKVIKVSIPVDITGEAVGVKTEGGFVDLMLRELEVECLPNIIPESIDIDISGLHMHQSLKVEDVILPDGVKMISEPDAVIVVIAAPTKEEPKAEEEMEEGLEEAAEGEEEGGQEEEGDEEPGKGA